MKEEIVKAVEQLKQIADQALKSDDAKTQGFAKAALMGIAETYKGFGNVEMGLPLSTSLQDGIAAAMKAKMAKNSPVKPFSLEVNFDEIDGPEPQR